MKNLFIFFIIIIFPFISCFIIGDQSEPTYYQPDKAKAEIISYYDISNFFNITTPLSDEDWIFKIVFSEYNDLFYLSYSKKGNTSPLKTVVINKNNFTKIREFENHFSNFYFINNCVYDKHFFIVCTINNNYKIIRTDLSGTNLKELDLSNDFGLQKSGFLGYNKMYDTLYLISNNTIYNYSYDSTNDKYIKISETGINISYDSISYIYGTKIIRAIDTDAPPSAHYSTIEMRDLTNLQKKIFEIDTYYLGGILSPVSDLLWDGEYLWIIVNRDNKLQLLKLKPL